MFTALRVEQLPRLGGWQGIKRALWPPSPTITTHHCLGIPWRLISVWPHRGKIPWDKVEILAGAHAKRLLLPSGITPPSGGGIKAFTSLKFRQNLGVNALMGILPQDDLTIGVVDARGAWIGQVENLVEANHCVKVYTRVMGLYEGFARRILEQYGATVVVCQNPESLRDCGVILLLGEDFMEWQRCTHRGCLVISEKSVKVSEFISLVEGFEILPPLWWQETYDCFDPTEFVGALYEVYRGGELEKMLPDVCRIAGQRCTFEQFCELSEDFWRKNTKIYT